MLEWQGETEIHPPSGVRRDPKEPFLYIDSHSGRYAKDLRDERPRLLRPDAIVEIEDPDSYTPFTYFLEFDRTRRVDKNYEKFRRYDCFLNWWWRHTEDFGSSYDDAAPWVIFICQNRDRPLAFLNAADHEMTGNVTGRWSYDEDSVGRRRIGFCLEHSMYERSPHIWLLPERPRQEWNENETGERRPIRAWLPGERAASASAAAETRRPR